MLGKEKVPEGGVPSSSTSSRTIMNRSMDEKTSADRPQPHLSEYVSIPVKRMVLPTDVLVNNVMPFLERKEWNQISLVTKEVYSYTKESSIIPPWPQKQFHIQNNDIVKSITFSPNGCKLAVIRGTFKRTVQIWDRELGYTHTLRNDADKCVNVSIPNRDSDNDNNEHIRSKTATTATDNTDLGGYTQELRLLHSHSNNYECLHVILEELSIFSRDFVNNNCKSLAVNGSHNNRRIRHWCVATGACIVDTRINAVCIAFAPHNKNSDGNNVDGHNKNVVAIGCQDGNILLWDLSNENQHCYFTTSVEDKHHERVNCIAFSPDGYYFASGSDDCTIRLWHNASIKIINNNRNNSLSCIKIFKDMTASTASPTRIWELVFSPEGKYIASIAMDETDPFVRVWNVVDGNCILKLVCPEVCHTLAFCPFYHEVHINKHDEISSSTIPLGMTTTHCSVQDDDNDVTITPRRNVLVAGGRNMLRFWNI